MAILSAWAVDSGKGALFVSGGRGRVAAPQALDVRIGGENQNAQKNHSAQVWRIENGKPVAWYEYVRDGYQFDAIWS
jgi:hypothetical protein